MIYIPLGTRCSAAGIIADRFKKREFSLPFDWIDTPLRNLTQFIDIEGDIAGFTSNYFDYFNKVHTDKHEDGTWFPHDLIPSKYTSREEMMSDVISRYTRRLDRLHEKLKLEEDKTFLSVMSREGDNSREDFLGLKEAIEKRSAGKLLFITINLMDTALENHFNFAVPFLPSNAIASGVEWAKWEGDIVDAINSNETTRLLFQ